MAAIQYLPYPMLLLDNQKTLVMANEAMGRLLDMEDQESATGEEISIVEQLWGKSLGQIGIDVLQNGRPVWVVWDLFLDAIASEMSPEEKPEAEKSEAGTEADTEADTETDAETQARGRVAVPEIDSTDPLTRSTSGTSGSRTRSCFNDTVIEVVISPTEIFSSSYLREDRERKAASLRHTYAKMIITVWGQDDQRYFMLTFTNTDTHHEAPKQRRAVPRPTRGHKNPSLQSMKSHQPTEPAAAILKHTSIYRRASIGPGIINPADISSSENLFPPLGPPSDTALSTASSSLQRLFVMKDALLDSTEVPILAMWKDGGLSITNKAARKLFHKDAKPEDIKTGYDILRQWSVWDDTFKSPLKPDEYPIMELIRTQEPFTNRRVGIISGNGRKELLECSGEAIRDETTGEFLAGMVTAKNITDVTEQIREIKAKEEQRFKLICETMPQMIFTTAPGGDAEWFSERW